MTAVPDSILDTTKHALQIGADDTVWDTDIILFINSVFSTLQQLGVGPDSQFRITDHTTTWASFIGSTLNIDNVQAYMYLRVKMLFDPPATSYTQQAFDAQIKEFEWRLNVAVDPSQPATQSVGPVAGTPSIWDLTGLPDFPVDAPVNAVGIDLLTGIIYRKTS